MPEVLENAIAQYLEHHPDWDRKRVDKAAIALFLMQYSEPSQEVSEIYLQTLFPPKEVART